MTYDSEIDDAATTDWATRRRQEQDLAHLETYYALQARFGIRVAIGGRVRRGDD
jgi:hypothetical protein